MARRLRSRVRGRTVTPPPNVGPEGIHCYLNRIAKTKSNKELVKGQRVSIVTYIDRVNISVTARQMMPALGLTDMQMGQVFSAFVLGYALFQIPGDGWATGGSLSPVVTPWLAEQAGWSTALGAAALVALLGGQLWVKIKLGDGLQGRVAESRSGC